MSLEPQLLPQSIGIGAGLRFQVVDFRDQFKKSAAAAANTMTVTFDSVDPDYFWEIERIALQVIGSAAASTAKIYAGDPGVTQNFRDSTLVGNLSVADNKSPIRLSATQALTVVWAGADNGSFGHAWCQFKLLKQVAG